MYGQPGYNPYQTNPVGNANYPAQNPGYYMPPNDIPPNYGQPQVQNYPVTQVVIDADAPRRYNRGYRLQQRQKTYWHFLQLLVLFYFCYFSWDGKYLLNYDLWSISYFLLFEVS